MLEKPTKGLRGLLIYEFVTDTFVFRVYDKDHNFKDYKICHYDLEVEILEDASLFEGTTEDGYDGIIDYPNEISRRRPSTETT